MAKNRERLEKLVEKPTAELRMANEQLQQEITERRQTEEVLREYQRAIEGSKDMITVVDQNYNYLLSNNAFLKYRGMDREQVVGRSVPEVLGKGLIGHPCLLRMFWWKWRGVRADNSIQRFWKFSCEKRFTNLQRK